MTTPPRPDRRRGYTVAVASAAVFSTTAILIRHLTERYQLPAGALSFWRSAFLVATLAAILALVRPRLLRARRADLGFLAGVGLVLATFNLLWTTSVARCGAALATVLVYTSGPFTAVLGLVLLRERPARWGVAAMGLCLAGCTLVSGALDGGPVHGDAVGIVLGLASGALYALYTVLGRAGARRGVDPWTMVLHAFAVNAVAQLLLLAVGPLVFASVPGLHDLWRVGTSTAGWWVLFALAAGPTLLGFGLFNLSLRDLPSAEANLVLTLEPALTAAIAFPLLGERLSPAELLGSGLILAGVALLSTPHRRSPLAAAGRERLDHA